MRITNTIVGARSKYKKQIKPVFFVLLLFHMFFCPGGLFAQNADNKVAERLKLTPEEGNYLQGKKVLQMPTHDNWKPFNFIENSIPQGYLIDLAKMLADKIGVKIEFIQGYAWAEHMQMLKDGNVDIVGNMVQTEERQKSYLFSHQKTLNLLTGLASFKQYTRINEIGNGTLGVQKGSVFDSFFKKHYPDQNVTYYLNLQELFKALVNREIDAFIENYSVINYLINTSLLFEKDLGVYLLEDEHRLDLPMHFAVSKNEPILFSVINKAYDAIAQKDLDNLKSKWEMSPKKKKSPDFTVDEKAWIQQHPQLKVGLYHAPPYSYTEFGEPKGYLVDIVRQVFERANLTPEFTRTLPLKTKLKMLRANELDVGIGLIKTEAREKFLDYTKTQKDLQVGIFARNDGPQYLNEKSLNGLTIASYHSYALAEKYIRKYQDIKIVNADDADGMMKLVSQGEAELHSKRWQVPIL
ncbi:transporter substrate-binding domain-containing protein [Desulfobacter hydrogenophilus]|nr:transporter substrate-binding domain-containing protein [Desulfobacter hydrogenophilus]NDY72887.1 transporter substrate-binding domain-containing protein [Desulfobacter hydrogenophilus]